MTTIELPRIEKTYGTTPKRDRARIERAHKAAIKEIVTRHLGEVELRYWAPRDGRMFNLATPALSRVYLQRGDEKLGFVGVRRSNRRPEGSYEQHRWTKGEDHYHTVFEAELPDDMLARLNAAVAEYLVRTDEAHRAADPDQFEYTYGQLAR